MSDIVSDERKVEIVTRFLTHAPPGEFNEVFQDVRTLLNNDALFKERCTNAIAQYNKDQFTPVRIESSDMPAIICEQNQIGDSLDLFYDPRSHQAFIFDHIRKEASNFRPYDADPVIEPWRFALETHVTAYVKNHFKFGVCSVFGKSASSTDTSSNNSSEEQIVLTVCIESHQFKPSNFWNGRWRSQWRAAFVPKAGNEVDIRAVIKGQVHYYEAGNVQLMSVKQMNKSDKPRISVSNENETAKAIVEALSELETEYQRGVNENYQTMSDTTFKALRRQLPVTRSKMDWNKIAGYRLATVLQNTKGSSDASSARN